LFHENRQQHSLPLSARRRKSGLLGSLDSAAMLSKMPLGKQLILLGLPKLAN
jgi:hypothetical protein